MLRFKEHLIEERIRYLTETLELLDEARLIQFGKGKRFGQVVFLAGGAASGKGFAKNFLSIRDFKVFDVDELKKQFLKLAKQKGKFPELKGLDLGNPKDVFILHKFVKDRGIVDKQLNAFLSGASPERLPNILFDQTLKDLKNIQNIIPKLFDVGYKPEDINLVWILTNYAISVERNQKRERRVPADILLKTQSGAAKTMFQILRGKIPKGVNGSIDIILNAKAAIIDADDQAALDDAIKQQDDTAISRLKTSGEITGLDSVDALIRKNAKDLKRSRDAVLLKQQGKLEALKKLAKKGSTTRIPVTIKSVPILNMKERAGKLKTEKDIQKQMFDWLRNNIPATFETGFIFSTIKSK